MADKKISALTAASTPLAGTEVLPIVQSGATVKVAVSDLTAGRAIAATSLTTAAVQASNSGGLALKNSGGTTQMTLGGGGGDNITLSVATNITPANAAVAISPTGTGTVAISPAGALTVNPTTASTINNVSIGATTALTGRFTDVTLTTGNLVVASGQGIDFSATSHPAGMTSELLADYEEGTWTPAVEFGGASVGVTYTSRQGTYTKIGRAVTIQCQVVLSSKGSSTGAMSVSGLPFTPQANTTAVTAWIDTSAATIVAPVTSLIFGSNPAVNFFFVSAGSQSNYTQTQAQDTSNIVITATYFV
jgi:hypothetical protein